MPLGRREVRVLRRWSEYAAHAVDGEHQQCRDKNSGRFTPTIAQDAQFPTAPIPLLTLVNRLFDVPPPLPQQLLVHCSAQHRRRLMNPAHDSMSTVHRGLDYECKQWPHFAEEFVSYEHLVLCARRQLFADSSRRCERGDWQYLLGSSSMVTVDDLPWETVAALGWAVSWLGSTRALAPDDETSALALGLMAWLVSLEPKPQGTARDRWHKQVSEWLNEDLRLSAWMWSRVARFMRAKGCYLLHGSMVNPQGLAKGRHVKVASSCMFTSIDS